MTELPDLAALQAQREELDRQIAAAKPQAVAAVHTLMERLGVTPADLGLQPISKGRGGSGAKRPIKYRDADGNTWTGIGQRPRWIQAALANGKALEDFRVPKGA